MLRFATALLLSVLSVAVWAGEAPTRRDLELELRAVQAEKEKYLAELSYGQRLMEEAQKNLPAKFIREKDLLDMLKRMDDEGKAK